MLCTSNFDTSYSRWQSIQEEDNLLDLSNYELLYLFRIPIRRVDKRTRSSETQHSSQEHCRRSLLRTIVLTKSTRFVRQSERPAVSRLQIKRRTNLKRTEDASGNRKRRIEYSSSLTVCFVDLQVSIQRIRIRSAQPSLVLREGYWKEDSYLRIHTPSSQNEVTNSSQNKFCSTSIVRSNNKDIPSQQQITNQADSNTKLKRAYKKTHNSPKCSATSAPK